MVVRDDPHRVQRVSVNGTEGEIDECPKDAAVVNGGPVNLPRVQRVRLNKPWGPKLPSAFRFSIEVLSRR
jgi:hypothetical protein